MHTIAAAASHRGHKLLTFLIDIPKSNTTAFACWLILRCGFITSLCLFFAFQSCGRRTRNSGGKSPAFSESCTNSLRLLSAIKVKLIRTGMNCPLWRHGSWLIKCITTCASMRDRTSRVCVRGTLLPSKDLNDLLSFSHFTWEVFPLFYELLGSQLMKLFFH